VRRQIFNTVLIAMMTAAVILSSGCMDDNFDFDFDDRIIYGSVSGNVYYSGTSLPIEDAAVFLSWIDIDSTRADITNAVGHYGFSGIEIGKEKDSVELEVVLTISKASFVTHVDTIIFNSFESDGATKVNDVYLVPAD